MTIQASKKNAISTDWHKTEVIAALHKRNLSLSFIGVSANLSRSALARALREPYPNGERIIAEALEMRPQDIWPSRYDANGVSVVGKGGRARMSGQINASAAMCNTQNMKAA
jgi:Ner family transcriptional regulator